MKIDLQTQNQIEERLVRYIVDYGWNWGVTMHQINGFFGTTNSVSQQQMMYKCIRNKLYSN